MDDLLPVSLAVIGHCIGIWKGRPYEVGSIILFPTVMVRITKTEDIISRLLILVL